MNLINYKTNIYIYIYNFQNFWTISTFDRNIYNGTITLKEADSDQANLLVEILNFKKRIKLKTSREKAAKKYVLKSLYNLFEVRQRVFNAFDNKIFSIKLKTHACDKISDHSNFKILTPKQMLQRLPIALAQVKAGNTSENLLNEIRQIIYSLYRATEITKKVYNNIMNSTKV